MLARIDAALTDLGHDPQKLNPEIELAIREALHPASGRPAAHFASLAKGFLKGILRNRLNEKIKDRRKELLHGRTGAAGSQHSSHSWTNDLKLDAKGGIRPILANYTLFLREHPAWKGVLAYDEFSACVVIRKRPPWGDPNASWTDTPWTDHFESLTRIWFQNEDINANQGDCGRAVDAAARSNPFHPVRGRFETLDWDGNKRIDTLLPVYFHTEDTPYTRAVGPRWLISGVARIYEPGCKVDHVLVLEGPQGRRSSEALRTLAVRDEWFTDRVSHLASKDAAQEMAGVFIVEFGELEPLLRATTGTGKAFITRRFDRYRPAYGKHMNRHLRGNIFAGTINPPPEGYLKDSTGSRRIWPVWCPSIDLEALARDCDQLWAEAIVRYKAGETWWLEPELEALATAEQAARYKTDSWQEPVEEWVGKRNDVGVAEVLEQALGFAPQKQNRSAEMRVAHILTDLGFSKHRPRIKGGARAKSGRQNRYWR
jgi:predicted P-loop ATPase